MRRAAVFICACTVSYVTAAEPKAFWVSDPVEPDDTVLVAGSGFGASPVVRLLPLKGGVRGNPDDAPAPAAWAKAVVVPVLQPTDESLKFVLPSALDPGTWLLRIESADGGISQPVRLNCPTVYWLQGDTGLGSVSPGGRLRIFGRCVGAPPAQGQVRLRQAGGTKTLTFKTESATCWSVELAVPADIDRGVWDVSVHNGLGRHYGWVHAGPITVAVAETWPDTVFNVLEYGATGDGTFEDALGIDMALAAAKKAGGGVIVFPRGRYLMDHSLELPRYTVLRGESRELSCIFWPDTDDPYVLVQGSDHFGVEDLTLYASNYTHAIAGAIGDAAETGHAVVRRVCLRAVLYRGHLKPDEVDRRFRASLARSTGGGDTIRLGGPNVQVVDCDLYGSGRAIYLYKPQGALVANNRLYNGRWGWYCLTGADGLIFENNTLTGADLMSTGGGINCLGATYSRNVYFAGNTIARCHGWDREAMTSDAGHGAYYGRITEADGATITLADEASWRGRERWTGGGVFILGGHGMGQYREIAQIADDERTVTVDRPWDVVPDGSSILTITMMQRNYLFIGNHFEDAGIALQYYGTSINHVASGNTCVRAGGFYNSGRWYRHYQPSWYCQFLGNEIRHGNCYRFGPNNATGAGESFLGTFGLQRGDNPAPLAYCSIHRRNRLHDNAGIRLIGVNRERPGLRDAVVEHNTVENAALGLSVDAGCVGVVERGNVFRNVATDRFDPEAQRRALDDKRRGLVGQPEPVYHQNFEQKSGRLFSDASGNGFVAVQRAGSVDQEPGFDGQAGRFDGTAYLEVNDKQMLRFPALTISAWILSADERGRWGVVTKRTRNTAAPYVLAIRDGRVTFEGTDTNGDWSYNFISESVLKADAWNHVAATCEEGKVIKLYCNGAQVAEKAVSGQLVETPQCLAIGYEAWGGSKSDPKASGNFRGLIDEVKVWSRILSADEMRQEFARAADAAEADTERRHQEAKERTAAMQRQSKDIVMPGGVVWHPVASDDFGRAELSANWLTLRGRWQVENGVLRCSETSFLALKTEVTAPVRIEFNARSDHPGDLTGFWGTRPDAYKGGYFIGFASNGNTGNKILRLGQVVAENDAPVAEPGRWYHVIAQVLADRAQLIVDGTLVLEHVDSTPVQGADTAGIIAWSEAEFDNVRVYTGQ